MRLHDVQERTVALSLEGGVVLRAAGGDAGDEAHVGEGQPELAEHLGVHFVVEVEDVTCVGVEYRHEFDTVMIGGGLLPADLGHEALPVGLSVLEGQEHRRAQAGLGAVVDEGFLGRPGPFRRGPRSRWEQVLGAVDQRLHGAKGLAGN